jgi:hypothetical protein
MRRFAAALLCISFLLFSDVGCASSEPSRSGQPVKKKELPPLAIDEIAGHVQSHTDRFISRVAQAYDEIESGSGNPKVRSWARLNKFGQTVAAVSIATGPNSYENAVDLVVMVALKRASLEANEAKSFLSPKEAELILEAYRRAEDTTWELAERVFSPAQLKEIRETIEEFRRENPDLRYLGFVRFADLHRHKPGEPEKASAPGSLLALFYLDPLAQLDPATREIHAARLLAERSAYLIQRMPVILQWATQNAIADSFDLPEPRRFITATTQFSAATETFANATAAYPQTFKTHIDSAVAQLGQIVDVQRKAATADLESQQSKLNTVVANVSASVDRAEQSALRVNSAAQQTVQTVEGTTQRTLFLAFWLTAALIAFMLVGIPLSALFYRRISGRSVKEKQRNGDGRGVLRSSS